jgi:hypothetical protein
LAIRHEVTDIEGNFPSVRQEWAIPEDEMQP